MATTTATKKIRALGLSSGGLDSIVSTPLLRSQGIEVEWVSFETPFFSSANAKKSAFNLKIPIFVKDITWDYLDMLRNPHCGYGQNMNPCLDCHALMFRLAGEIMEKERFDFLFSGEVVGQRPMSQTKASLRYVEKNSGFDGYILRPLSAKILPLSIPEKEGKVNRELLFDISGRSRKIQIELAGRFHITDYPGPGGGCRLTDKVYSARLKDLFSHQKDFTKDDLYLLKYGRHIRFNEKTKIIVGRNKQENDKIMNHYNAHADCLIELKGIPGPVVLVPKGRMEDIFQAASICAGYCNKSFGKKVEVLAVTPDRLERIKVTGTSPSENRDMMI